MCLREPWRHKDSLGITARLLRAMSMDDRGPRDYSPEMPKAMSGAHAWVSVVGEPACFTEDDTRRAIRR